jgi:hypothetical protein
MTQAEWDMREPRITSKPQGFGKRGQVSMPGAGRPQQHAPEPEKPTSTSGMSLPKWLIGGAAALLLMGLISGGTGGGFLGGLLGGLLANKLINANKPATGPAAPSNQADRNASNARSPSATAPAASPSASQTSVSRGGLGTTSSSGGSSFFGG